MLLYVEHDLLLFRVKGINIFISQESTSLESGVSRQVFHPFVTLSQDKIQQATAKTNKSKDTAIRIEYFIQYDFRAYSFFKLSALIQISYFLLSGMLYFWGTNIPFK